VGVAFALVAVSLGGSQESAAPVRVVIKDGKHVAPEAAIDPQPHISVGYGGGMYFGLSVDNVRITCTPNISVMSTARIDNQLLQPGFDPMGQPSLQRPLPPGPFGKKRLGTQTQWMQNNLRFTQIVETIPSRLRSGAKGQDKRRLDTVRVSVFIENTGTQTHMVEYRTFIDTMIADNDGALFASPTTAPGAVLDGKVLENKLLPEYLQVLERPNLDNPGFVATMTLRFGNKMEGPNRVVLANTAAFNGNWDAPPVKANGDSAAFLYWPAKSLKPREKRTLVWAYGGGIASNVENEDNVALALGGSFAPGKLFTVTATVDDPLPGQSLTLELPPGMLRVEGSERQPVPAPGASSMSAVLWKARVERLGAYELKVHSSTGVTHVRNISIQPAQ
jgi:hypothetical protein